MVEFENKLEDLQNDVGCVRWTIWNWARIKFNTNSQKTNPLQTRIMQMNNGCCYRFMVKKGY